MCELAAPPHHLFLLLLLRKTELSQTLSPPSAHLLCVYKSRCGAVWGIREGRPPPPSPPPPPPPSPESGWERGKGGGGGGGSGHGSADRLFAFTWKQQQQQWQEVKHGTNSYGGREGLKPFLSLSVCVCLSPSIPPNAERASRTRNAGS